MKLPMAVLRLRSFATLIVLCVSALSAGLACASDLSHPKVAVVGAGSGGAATVHFLRELFPSGITIDVFDAASSAGGRAQSIEIKNRLYEAGASILVQQNRYIKRMADLAGVKAKKPADSSLAIWDGSQMVFRTSPYALITVAKLLFRYGFSLSTIKDWSNEFVDKFANVYDLQEQGQSFDTPVEFWEALGLYNYTQVAFSSVMPDIMNSAVMKELVTGIFRNIYNQDTDMNALAGALALAPLAIGSEDVWQAETGNFDIYQKTIRAGSNLHLNSRVLGVERSDSEGAAASRKFSLRVKSTVTGETLDHSGYDAVVLAAPLESLGVDFAPNLDVKIPRRRPFQRVYVTFVRGRLNPEYFGLSRDDHDLNDILTVEDPTIPFSCLSVENPEVPDGPDRVVKMFSRTEPDSFLLNRLFLERYETKQVSWDAYPKFQAPEEFAPFKLGDGIYYPSAVENGCSAMEVMAAGARNVAIMISKDFGMPEAHHAPHSAAPDLSKEEL